jgi:hypothetical protein
LEVVLAGSGFLTPRRLHVLDVSLDLLLRVKVRGSGEEAGVNFLLMLMAFHRLLISLLFKVATLTKISLPKYQFNSLKSSGAIISAKKIIFYYITPLLGINSYLSIEKII